ncbi:hypothetical protein ACI2LC_17580 [Nonomuraea wenchangensis]|uniref:hypothetical protein n=1 Tax=Nonomuraea wenchangensis TaxID=568860 RepID=UPI003850CD63
MQTNVPPADHNRCHLPWCQVDHRFITDHHSQMLADITNANGTEINIEVHYILGVEDDAKPFIGVLYGPTWRAQDKLEIPVDAAVALAEVLRLAVAGGCFAEFADAIMHAATGPHTAKRTQW